MEDRTHLPYGIRRLEPSNPAPVPSSSPPPCDDSVVVASMRRGMACYQVLTVLWVLRHLQRRSSGSEGLLAYCSQGSKPQASSLSTPLPRATVVLEHTCPAWPPTHTYTPKLVQTRTKALLSTLARLLVYVSTHGCSSTASLRHSTLDEAEATSLVCMATPAERAPLSYREADTCCRATPGLLGTNTCVCVWSQPQSGTVTDVKRGHEESPMPENS